MVGIDEALAGDLPHGLQDTGIGHAARLDLLGHHAVPQ